MQSETVSQQAPIVNKIIRDTVSVQAPSLMTKSNAKRNRIRKFTSIDDEIESQAKLCPRICI